MSKLQKMLNEYFLKFNLIFKLVLRFKKINYLGTILLTQIVWTKNYIVRFKGLLNISENNRIRIWYILKYKTHHQIYY